MKKFTVSVGESPTATREQPGVLIEGTVFAITTPFGPTQDRWTLTHLPTGWRVCGGNSQRKLRLIAKRLNDLPTASLADTKLITADGAAWKAIIQAGL